jgi:cytidylate kinase
MIRVITIEREYGAGGGSIARKVAESLGWKLWDQMFTCEIARIANCEQSEVASREERVDPLYYRLIKSVMRGSFEGNLNLRSLHCLDADSIQRITKQITERAAEEGNCVLLGRGSQYHLRDRSDTLRIFLFAPREDKIRRLAAEGIPAAEAEQLVDTVDQERSDFIDKYFQMEWPNRSLYHALLNTAAGEAVVISTILGLKEKMDKMQAPSAFQVS